ncbi:MAG: F0F1 ATP synthase subunit delta [bacterium]|nr:F0F1 ATP synthase subunit delta [bacterium]
MKGQAIQSIIRRILVQCRKQGHLDLGLLAAVILTLLKEKNSVLGRRLTNTLIMQLLHTLKIETKAATISIKTAIPLSASMKKECVVFGEKNLGTKAEDIQEDQDTSLIGGIVLQANDRVWDASIAGKFASLQKEVARG